MPIQFHQVIEPGEGVRKFAGEIVELLKGGKKALWLIAGGSNIPVAADVEKLVRRSVTTEELKSLTISQTDERYGPVGHKDSNWKQMIDEGFDFSGMATIPILRGKSLEETVQAFAADIEAAFKSADIIIGQFGIGADGHIAGILPHSVAVNENAAVSGYESKPFMRITLTPRMIEQIDVAYAFAFGEAKREAMQDLKNKKLSVDEEPAQLLKSAREVHVFSDVI